MEPQKKSAFIDLAIIANIFLTNDLKAFKIANSKYIVTNTCAIDCLLQILFCDSSDYEFKYKLENKCGIVKTTADNFLLYILQKLFGEKLVFLFLRSGCFQASAVLILSS